MSKGMRPHATDPVQGPGYGRHQNDRPFERNAKINAGPRRIRDYQIPGCGRQKDVARAVVLFKRRLLPADVKLHMHGPCRALLR